LAETACKNPDAILMSKHDSVEYNLDRLPVFDIVLAFGLKTITITKKAGDNVYFILLMAARMRSGRLCLHLHFLVLCQ